MAAAGTGTADSLASGLDGFAQQASELVADAHDIDTDNNIMIAAALYGPQVITPQDSSDDNGGGRNHVTGGLAASIANHAPLRYVEPRPRERSWEKEVSPVAVMAIKARKSRACNQDLVMMAERQAQAEEEIKHAREQAVRCMEVDMLDAAARKTTIKGMTPTLELYVQLVANFSRCAYFLIFYICRGERGGGGRERERERERARARANGCTISICFSNSGNRSEPSNLCT